jgi:hypothetical protein
MLLLRVKSGTDYGLANDRQAPPGADGYDPQRVLSLAVLEDILSFFK